MFIFLAPVSVLSPNQLDPLMSKICSSCQRPQNHGASFINIVKHQSNRFKHRLIYNFCHKNESRWRERTDAIDQQEDPGSASRTTGCSERERPQAGVQVEGTNDRNEDRSGSYNAKGLAPS